MRLAPGRSLSFSSLAVVAALTLAPASHAAGPAPAAPPVVTITATDFGFEAPATMPAGAVTIRLVNEGRELHHAQLLRLDDGKTMEELGAAMHAGGIPSWVTFVGGPGLVAPGMEASATIELRPGGNYFWLCAIESPDDHMPHMAKGMVKPVTVEATAREPLPQANNTLMLNDYDFVFGRPLTAGRQVIRVRNAAPQPHEVMFIKLMPGKTLDHMLAWMGGGMQGPPPGIPMGGMQALSQGLAGNLELVFEPGDYALVCFIPDSGDGRPHLAHGMARQFTVE